MLKLPIPDIRHKSLMCGERAGTSFVGRMQAMIHPGEQPAPGTLAYHFCMANCPGIGGTGFSWIPLQIVGVEVGPIAVYRPYVCTLYDLFNIHSAGRAKDIYS